jgi:taurine transport system substrate-binding protein
MVTSIKRKEGIIMHAKTILKKLLVLVTVTSLALSVCACSSSQTETDTTGAASTDGNASSVPDEIRIGYWASPNSELLVKELGSLEEKYPDTKVTWMEFTSGADILTAMQGGSIDLATIGTPPGTTGIANDYPFHIYYLEDITGESEGLIVRNDSGIDSLQDLEGKTIATSFSTTSHFSLLKALEFAGVDSSKINLMDMDASNIYAAWERGDIDGAYIWESVKTQLLEDDGKEIISSKDVAEEGAMTGEFGIVHDDFYAKYPNVVSDYIDLLDEATDLFNNDTENAAEIMSQGLGLTEEETLKAMNGITEVSKDEQLSYFGTEDSPGSFTQILKDTADFLYEEGKLTESPDIQVFQNAILTELYQ